MSGGRWRAFQGANGWYVAWENGDGFHHEGSPRGTHTEREAKATARRLNREAREHGYGE